MRDCNILFKNVWRTVWIWHLLKKITKTCTIIQFLSIQRVWSPDDFKWSKVDWLPLQWNSCHNIYSQAFTLDTNICSSLCSRQTVFYVCLKMFIKFKGSTYSVWESLKSNGEKEKSEFFSTENWICSEATAKEAALHHTRWLSVLE